MALSLILRALPFQSAATSNDGHVQRMAPRRLGRKCDEHLLVERSDVHTFDGNCGCNDQCGHIDTTEPKLERHYSRDHRKPFPPATVVPLQQSTFWIDSREHCKPFPIARFGYFQQPSFWIDSREHWKPFPTARFVSSLQQTFRIDSREH